MTQPLLGDLDIDSLLQHDGGAKMSQVMEATLWKVGFGLELRQKLAHILRVDRLAIWVNNDVISNSVGSTHAQLIFHALGPVCFELLDELGRDIQGAVACGCFGVFQKGLSIYDHTITMDMDFMGFPVYIIPLQT